MKRCIICNKEFIPINSYNQKTCSLECKKIQTKERIRRYQKNHPDIFIRNSQKWLKKNPKKFRKYQKTYYSKEENKMRRSDYYKYRIILINTLGRKCQNCGATEKLEIHEETYNPKIITINDCKVLCRKCHIEYHKQKNQYII